MNNYNHFHIFSESTDRDVRISLKASAESIEQVKDRLEQIFGAHRLEPVSVLTAEELEEELGFVL